MAAEARRIRVGTFGLGALAVGTFMGQTAGAASRAAARPLTAAARVSANAVGAVRIGMTLGQAERATGQRFVGLGGGAGPVGGTACSYVRAQGGPPGLSFMLNGTRIVRLDLAAPNKSTATTRAIRRGDTEAAVKRAYAGRIAVTPSKYVTGGHDLVYTPASAALARYRIVFQTDGHQVGGILAGRVPEVNLVEGCS